MVKFCPQVLKITALSICYKALFDRFVKEKTKLNDFIKHLKSTVKTKKTNRKKSTIIKFCKNIFNQF